MGPCHRLTLFRERHVQRSVEMEFQQTDTSNASGVQKLPTLNELWFFFNRELSLQGPEHTAKDLSLLLLGCIITRKMDIHTATRQLRIDFPKGTKFVGPDQNMAHASHILKIFQLIKLVLESPSTRRLGQVVSLIHNDGDGLTMQKRGFHRFTQFSGGNPSRSAVYKGILEGSQDG